MTQYTEKIEEVLVLYAIRSPEKVVHIFSPDDFLNTKCKKIYSVVKSLYEEGRFDYSNLIIELRSSNLIEYLFSLTNEQYLDYIISSGSIDSLIEHKKNEALTVQLKRKLYDAASQSTKEEIILKMRDAETLMEQSNAQVNDLSYLLRKYVDEVTFCTSFMPGIVPTGFKSIDQKIGGVEGLTIIAARPGTGKTSLMLAMALHMAESGKKVLFASIEMNRNKIMPRILALMTHISLSRIKFNTLIKEEKQAIELAVEMSKKYPIYFIDDTSSISDIIVASRLIKPDVLFIDYLQLLTSTMHFENRNNEVAYYSRSLRELVRRDNIVVVAASQLSRAVESRANKRPQLSDLRESGALEQDADMVFFIYREDAQDKVLGQPELLNLAEIIIAKNRNGETGTVNLRFEKELTMFTDLPQIATG